MSYGVSQKCVFREYVHLSTGTTTGTKLTRSCAAHLQFSNASYSLQHVPSKIAATENDNVNNEGNLDPAKNANGVDGSSTMPNF